MIPDPNTRQNDLKTNEHDFSYNKIYYWTKMFSSTDDKVYLTIYVHSVVFLCYLVLYHPFWFDSWHIFTHIYASTPSAACMRQLTKWTGLVLV